MNSCAKNLRTPADIVEEYIELNKNKLNTVNKKRKDIERRIQQIQDEYKFIEQDKGSFQRKNNKEKEIMDLNNQYNGINTFIQSGVQRVLDLLREEGFVSGTNIDDMTLPLIGKIASQLREAHCLVFSRLYEENMLTKLTSKQLVAIFSCFTNIVVQDDFKDNRPRSQDAYVNDIINKVCQMYNEYQNKEVQRNINTGMDYNIHYDLLNFTEEWCDAQNVDECKLILQKISEEKGIFLGEFVKALLKINNISCELEKIAEMTGNVEFLSKLKEIPNMTLKYVVTNQSLYV